MKFNFKVNASKLQDANKLKNQIELVVIYLKNKYNINSTETELTFDTAGVDIISNIFRLRVTFND